MFYQGLPTFLCLGKVDSPACSLCLKRGTLEHILSYCLKALGEGRYWWHHDQVLKTIADTICSGITASVSTQWSRPSLLSGLRFPATVSITMLRPDMVLISESSKLDLIVTHCYLGGPHWGDQWEEEGEVCRVGERIPRQHVAGEVRARPSAGLTICWASQRPVGEGPWSWLPRQKLCQSGCGSGEESRATWKQARGLDQPRLGHLGKSVWLLEDPKHSETPGNITDDVCFKQSLRRLKIILLLGFSHFWSLTAMATMNYELTATKTLAFIASKKGEGCSDSGHKKCEHNITKEQMWVWHLLVQRNVVSENNFSMSEPLGFPSSVGRNCIWYFQVAK